MATARSFKPALAKMYLRRKPNVYLRSGVCACEIAAGRTMVARRRETISRNRSLKSSGERLVSIAPAEATEIEPVSSEISTTRQSLSSVIPIAARCRVPSCFEIIGFRSEEHTSELQSRSDLVCRPLLEKKK